MPQRLLNTFYPWIKQDNYLTGWASFIEWKNIDWLKEWIGITLWPKVNKLFTTQEPMRAINFIQTSSVDLRYWLIAWDNWNIYRADSVDNTPVFTATWEVRQIVVMSNFYYLFILNGSNLIDIYKINTADVLSNNWDWLTITSATNLWSSGCPPYLVTWSSEMYIWLQGSVVTFDWTTITDTFTPPSWEVVWLSLQWSTVAIYSNNGKTYFWDWAATLESGRWYMWARIERIVNRWGQDYVTCEDWQLRVSSYTQSQRIFKPNQSYRLEDNSILSTKLDFSYDDIDWKQNNTSISALDDLYFYWSDTVKWIYKYWSLFPWLSNGIHKIITQNHEGTQIDYIYDMFFYERTDRILYFSYKAWTTYWVDYIDLDSLETCTSWYWVTEVFTGWTAFKKKLDVIRMSVSNVDENNTASLYYRVNNQDWVLIRTINSVTDDIYYRENIFTESTWVPFKEFIDVQFKVELNWEWTDTPPTLNELLWSYTITEA